MYGKSFLSSQRLISIHHKRAQLPEGVIKNRVVQGETKGTVSQVCSILRGG